MSDPSEESGEHVCPRCRALSAGSAWCQKCGLNLRLPYTAPAEPATYTHQRYALSHGTPPPTPFARGWRRLMERDPTMVMGVVAAVSLLAVVVAVVLATKGGGHPQPTVPNDPFPTIQSTETTATPTEPTNIETTQTEATTTTASVEAPQVEGILNSYEQDYSSESLESFQALFSPTLERRDGTHATEDLNAAMATYKKQFSQLVNPTYTLSEINVTPGNGEATATAKYKITSQNGTVTGSITFHLTETEEKLLIDKLTIEPAK